MAPNQHALSLEEIQNYLRLFENINHKTNYSCLFEFVGLEKPESVEATLQKYYEEMADIAPDSLALDRVADAKAALQTALVPWLFNFLIKGDQYVLPEEYRELIDVDEDVRYWNRFMPPGTVLGLVESMLRVAQPTATYKVNIQPMRLYELVWEDFALEGEDQVFLLHLGFCD
jgi:hypothetical protein